MKKILLTLLLALPTLSACKTTSTDADLASYGTDLTRSAQESDGLYYIYSYNQNDDTIERILCVNQTLVKESCQGGWLNPLKPDAVPEPVFYQTLAGPLTIAYDLEQNIYHGINRRLDELEFSTSDDPNLDADISNLEVERIYSAAKLKRINDELDDLDRVFGRLKESRVYQVTQDNNRYEEDRSLVGSFSYQMNQLLGIASILNPTVATFPFQPDFNQPNDLAYFKVIGTDPERVMTTAGVLFDPSRNYRVLLHTVEQNRLAGTFDVKVTSPESYFSVTIADLAGAGQNLCAIDLANKRLVARGAESAKSDFVAIGQQPSYRLTIDFGPRYLTCQVGDSKLLIVEHSRGLQPNLSMKFIGISSSISQVNLTSPTAEQQATLDDKIYKQLVAEARLSAEQAERQLVLAGQRRVEQAQQQHQSELERINRTSLEQLNARLRQLQSQYGGTASSLNQEIERLIQRIESLRRQL